MQSHPSDYIKDVLERYKTNDSNLLHIESHFKPMIALWAGEYFNDLKVMGSVAQHTSIKKEFDADLDLLVSLKPGMPYTHEEIFDSLRRFLVSKRFKVEVRNISMRIVYKGVAVDFVPAIKFPGNTDNHWVWSTKRERQEKSNVQKHIDIVKSSGRREEIKALKVWTGLNDLKFPGFYLSLVVIEALKGKSKGDLPNNILTILKYLENKFIYAKFMDPSNSEDEISKDLEESEKKAVAKAAKLALKHESWNEIFSD